MNPKVALAQDFLSNLSKLPSSIQSKVLKWALKFQSDPTANGINYETIKGARDKNLRSVRIDQDWRGIVFKPDKGDVYVLMYVDILIAKPDRTPGSTQQFDKQRLEYVALTRAKRNATVIRIP